MTDVSDSPMFESPDFGGSDEELDDNRLDDEPDEEEIGVEVGEIIASADDSDDSPNRADRSDGEAARAVLDHVTSSLVDDPSAVVVEETRTRSGVRYSVHVAPGDMGRLIGRRGRTVQALRTLVRAAAASEGRDASVDVVD